MQITLSGLPLLKIQNSPLQYSKKEMELMDTSQATLLVSNIVLQMAGILIRYLSELIYAKPYTSNRYLQRHA